MAIRSLLTQSCRAWKRPPQYSGTGVAFDRPAPLVQGVTPSTLLHGAVPNILPAKLLHILQNSRQYPGKKKEKCRRQVTRPTLDIQTPAKLTACAPEPAIPFPHSDISLSSSGAWPLPPPPCRPQPLSTYPLPISTIPSKCTLHILHPSPLPPSLLLSAHRNIRHKPQGTPLLAPSQSQVRTSFPLNVVPLSTPVRGM